MTTIRSTSPVPTPSARRVKPAGDAASSQDRPPRQDRALVLVPTPRNQRPQQPKTAERARNAAAEVLVQIIAGPQRRGLKAESSELERYRRTYARAAEMQTPPPMWERRA